MDRREFLTKGGAVVAGGLLADLGTFEQAAGGGEEDPQPAEYRVHPGRRDALSERVPGGREHAGGVLAPVYAERVFTYGSTG